MESNPHLIQTVDAFHRNIPDTLYEIGQIFHASVMKFEWEVPHSFFYPSVQSYKSKTVTFGNIMWRLEIYPHYNSGAFSIYLKQVTVKDIFLMEVTLGFRKRSGEVEYLVCDRNFISDHLNRVYKADCKIADIEQRLSDLVEIGSLTIVCTLKGGNLPTKLEKYPIRGIELKCGVEKLSDDLCELMKSGNESDVTIVVKGEEFRLHRNILEARVPVFRSMFCYDMKEKTTGVVCINDCEVKTFQEFIHFVYCGKVNKLSVDTVFGLFVLADKYQTDELRSACLDFIIKKLSMETFCDAVNLALNYDLTYLLEHITDYFALKMTEILETAGWVNFLEDNHVKANELLLKALRRKDESASKTHRIYFRGWEEIPLITIK